MRPEIEPTTQTMISPDYLVLDANNPRLFLEARGRDQESLLKSLANTADLKELIQSITENGYLSIEPLIIAEHDDGEHFVVLEGNRRLAAIRLLKDRELAKRCRISTPETLSPEVQESLEEVAVYRVAKVSDARSLIGFKHVNGPHKWESYAKAQFAYKWYIDEKDHGLTIDDIAAKLGDNNNTVRALVSAMFVLEQAKSTKTYDINTDRTASKFAYSHFYTALNRSEYKEFLGLDKNWSLDPVENPIKEENLERLNHVLVGLYGSKADKRPPVISSQNPDLKHFGEVLTNEESYDVFKSEHTSLKELYALAGDPLQHIKDAFIKINSQLDTISTVLDRATELDEATKTYVEQFNRKQEKIRFQLSYLLPQEK
ncbi:ParB N-terminal domain-containing protein [Vibrio furnissii]|uniref:ParB N-terminal domain-containing protein n=1 Tax=Vibrio furnissii TaxID=29494 RepID=UPI003749F9E1